MMVPIQETSNNKHIDYSTKHEDLYGALTLLEAREIHAKNAIGQAENEPGDQARSEQVARHTPKS